LLNLTWNRRERSPDFNKTIRGITKRMVRDAGAACEGTEAVAPAGVLARYSCDQGQFSAAIFRPDPDEPVTLILRQLSPGSSDQLRDVIRNTRVYHADETIPWRLHGLKADLAPAWRLQGIQQFTGLVRGVWFRGTGKLHRHDQALVMRRYACAERMLAGQDFTTWVSERLGKGEALLSHRVDADGVWRGVCSVPPDNWLKRWRGKKDARYLDAWIEAETDRLVIQEWKGIGTAIEPLTAYHPPMHHPLITGHDAA
jgi:hypothetical protein